MLTIYGRTAAALILAVFITAAAQQSTGAPVKGMGSTVGLYVYPQKQQTAAQQLTDEQQCYNNAKSQTGFDPNATTTASNSAAKTKKDHGAAKGALGGAALSGATGGDAAAGARRGALVGGIRARRKEQKPEAQAEKQMDANKTQQEQKQENFKRAMSACLSARSYSVR
jgi:hypothetical protein